MRYPSLALSALVARSILRLRARSSRPSPVRSASASAGLRRPRHPDAGLADTDGRVGAPWMATDITDDCARIIAPTLLITGEPDSIASCRSPTHSSTST